MAPAASVRRLRFVSTAARGIGNHAPGSSDLIALRESPAASGARRRRDRASRFASRGAFRFRRRRTGRGRCSDFDRSAGSCDELISSRIRWPCLKTFEVDHMSILNSSTLPGVSMVGVVREFAASRADDSVGEIERGAARAHVDQLGGEVGVGRGRGRVQSQRDRAGHFEVFGERFGRIDEHVGAMLHRLLIECAAVQRAGDSSRVRRRRSARDRADCRGNESGGSIAGRIGRERAVAVHAVGAAAAVQVVAAKIGAGRAAILFRRATGWCPSRRFAPALPRRRRALPLSQWSKKRSVLPSISTETELDAKAEIDAPTRLLKRDRMIPRADDQTLSVARRVAAHRASASRCSCESCRPGRCRTIRRC